MYKQNTNQGYLIPMETVDPFDQDLHERDFDDNFTRNYIYSRDGEIIYLKFKANTIYTFPSKKFLDYGDVTYLSLANNHLKNLDEDLFVYFPNLTWLDVRDNRIQTFPKVTHHKSLEQILLGGNKIEKLPIELGSFENLYGIQVTGNPLTFPDLKVLENSNCNLVEFLKLCWKHQTKNPFMKTKPERKAKKKQPLVKKEEVMAPVQQYRNVASVVAEKIKSSDPIDQLMASNVLKKLRAIEQDLKRSNEHSALKDWREKYLSTNVRGNYEKKIAPYGIDPDFMSMMTRRELIESEDIKLLKKKPPRQKKKLVNINEELKKVDMELGSLKLRKPSLDPTAEKTQRMMDIQKMNNIQKKIKELQLANLKNSV